MHTYNKGQFRETNKTNSHVVQTVGESRSTQKKDRYTQGEQANSTDKDPGSGFKFRTFLLLHYNSATNCAIVQPLV